MQTDNAAHLLQELLDACAETLGPNHRETLVIKVELGILRYLQGRPSDARKLQEEAVTVLTALHGVEHEDTLNAIDSLGRKTLIFRTPDNIARSRELHLRAFEGIRKIHGLHHLRTLIACENLCSTAVQSGNPTHLSGAREMMVEVYEKGKEKLGKEHGYTLLAMVNLALVKSALDDLQGAEELMLIALPIAERNLGAGHIAYLWGRYQFGCIWGKTKTLGRSRSTSSRRYRTAKKSASGTRVVPSGSTRGLVELATVYNALRKHEECKQVVQKALSGFAKISTREHPIAKKLKNDMEVWVKGRGMKMDSVIDLVAEL